ncbi:MAG TPA: tetratricopeptide repeat protein [Candidatus Binataceae bacterium]|nr:tetratricopeptide repeat protein [Candidatus Binataceae bacterium]
MNSTMRVFRLGTALSALGALLFLAGSAYAQSLAELDTELGSVEGQLSAAESSEQAGKDMVGKLDHLESQFAEIANGAKTDKSGLAPTYSRLESALNRIYNAYKKKKDDCIAQIDQGGQCDYNTPEQIALGALYPLSWLRFTAATTVYGGDENMSRRLLNEAIDGFTESTLVVAFDANLMRENVLGRAYCEKELAKFDKTEYDKAIADFLQIYNDGPATQQYKAANQGLATTYMAMGEPEKAKKYAGGMATTGGGLMLRLATMFSAENAKHDPAARAAQHKEIVDVLKGTEDNKESWAISIAAVGKYVMNPVAEFGSSSDPFEKWLLANVLLNRKDDNGAAKYFVEAARGSSKYAKGFRNAAAIYEAQHRYDLVESLLGDIARSGGPDAQWATYMRYKLPRTQWENSGQKNAGLESQWVKGAEDYLKTNAGGQYAPEVRFRLAERLQRGGQYLDAAKMYDSITGTNEYSFTAKFNSAECDYLALVAASSAKEAKGAPQVNADELRQATIKGLEDTIKMEPEALRIAPASQHAFVHDTKGRAILLLVGLLEYQKNADPKQVADLLDGFESQYPSMSERSRDVAEWRMSALDQLGRYDEVERSLRAIIEKNRGNTAQSDFIKELGLDFWKVGQAAQAKGDDKAYRANAKLASVAYGFFEDLVQAGKTPAKNLTGTLSILGQAYMAQNDEAKAEAVFQQVVKADPASPDANAGLARIAQAKKDYKDAVTMWTNVENTAAESDPLWYDAKYNVALIYSEQGNIQGACSKLAQTRAEHPSLGTPEMKNRWDQLQRKLCLDHK